MNLTERAESLVRNLYKTHTKRYFYSPQGTAAMALIASTINVKLVRNDFKVGGTYQLDMLDQGLTVFSAHGEYREIVPVTKLVFTWNSALVQNTLVIVELRDLGETTELTLTHQLLSDAEQVTQHAGGWEACVSNLLKYLSGGK